MACPSVLTDNLKGALTGGPTLPSRDEGPKLLNQLLTHPVSGLAPTVAARTERARPSWPRRPGPLTVTVVLLGGGAISVPAASP